MSIQAPAVGYLSKENSTEAALDNGEYFTGASKDCSSYSSVTVGCKSDVAGILYMEFSVDQNNWDSSLAFSVAAGVNEVHRLAVTRPFYRTRFYNNSGSNQSYLRLSTIFGHQGILTSPLNLTVQQDGDAIPVRVIDYEDDVALGRRTGVTLWNKFGYNNDVDISSSPELIAAQGGSITILSAASTLTLVSSSTSDASGGTGATQVIIYGIDANRIAQTEVVSMNGTTNVVTTSTWLGINRVSVYLCGSSQSNVGNITVTATTGGSTQAYLPATEGTTQQCAFFTQDGYTFLANFLTLTASRIGSGTEPTVTFKAFVYSFVSQSKYEVFRYAMDTNVENSYTLSDIPPFVIGEKSVLWFEASSTRDDTSVSCRFSGKEIKNL